MRILGNEVPVDGFNEHDTRKGVQCIAVIRLFNRIFA